MASGDRQREKELDIQIIKTLIDSNKMEHVLKVHGGNLDAPDAFIEVEAYALEDNLQFVLNLLDAVIKMN